MSDRNDRDPQTDRPQADDAAIDPKHLEQTREALARADSSHSPTTQGTGTGSGSAQEVDRGPADTAKAAGGTADTPAATGAHGVSTGLQPGGTIPTTGAGGTGENRGSMRTPGPGAS